ncbi:hypothetical protein R3P38DRAFT_2844205 [Favolaschia claudopus]|uniref:F-box domain-containing protein n=1 Tax=Favolaschia claudopus TaxID=2862362 RepID=A0AAW0E1V6_9AGAR
MSRPTHKPIHDWFPNELLASMIRHSPVSDLFALCTVSPTPVLYRTVVIYSTPRTLELFRTLEEREQGAGPPLTPHIRCFRIHQNFDLRVNLHKPLPPLLMNALTHHLAQMRLLDTLDLSSPNALNFTEVLEDIYFPKLSRLRLLLTDETAARFPAFLNRHRTIVDLGFGPFLNEGMELSGRIRLPNLRIYDGPSSLLSFFELHTTSLEQACLQWFPLNRDIVRPFAYLASLSPRLKTLVVISMFSTLGVVPILESVVKHLRDIQILRFQTPKQEHFFHISEDDLTKVANHLKKLPMLTVLEFPRRRFTLESESDEKITDALKLWRSACPKLSEVTFHDSRWQWAQGRWFPMDKNRNLDHMLY